VDNFAILFRTVGRDDIGPKEQRTVDNDAQNPATYHVEHCRSCREKRSADFLQAQQSAQCTHPAELMWQ